MSQSIRVLCLGDLVGRPGRRIIRECLADAVKQHGIDFTIVNVENASNGIGPRKKEADELLSYSIDCMTTGDHIYDHPEINDWLASNERMLRPENYDLPGKGAAVYASGDVKVGVINAAGEVFMKERKNQTNAFHAVDNAIRKLKEETPIIFVDMHGEVTSEKVAMGWFCDGRVSGVFGSHTHVQTADACVLPRGTGYITDLGMTGPHDGVIGRDKEAVLERFTDGKKTYMSVARGDIRMNGAIFEVDKQSGKCVGVELFSQSMPDKDSTPKSDD
ncbi:MAG: TIGR00282 family metallophosphoesterase [Planctomycetota bacterium]|jgi:metallophosphoesterase (TIGR00282 family)